MTQAYAADKSALEWSHVIDGEYTGTVCTWWFGERSRRPGMQRICWVPSKVPQVGTCWPYVTVA